MWERCRICKDFRAHTKKDRDTRHRFILMEAALCLPSELSWFDSAPSTSASVSSAPRTFRSQCQSPCLAPTRDVDLTFWEPQHCPSSLGSKKTPPAKDSWHRSPSPLPKKKLRKMGRGQSPTLRLQRDSNRGRSTPAHSETSTAHPVPLILAPEWAPLSPTLLESPE